jgi:Na+/proline symporter
MPLFLCPLASLEAETRGKDARDNEKKRIFAPEMTIIIIILAYFAVLMCTAHVTGRRSKGSDDAFYRGEKRSPWYIVAFGMVGASISGVTFVSVPGMVQSVDMTYMQMVIGFFFGYMVVAHVLMPVYYRLNLTSIYGYLGHRLGRHSYLTGSTFFLLSRMLGTAAKLYLVCLILHTYVFKSMGVPFWAIAVGAVVLVWIYTHKSGIKTIVWTDTLQTLCLVTALVCIIVVTMNRLHFGMGDAVQAIAANSHSRMFVFDDWVSTQNFWKQFLSGIFIVIVMTGLDQDMMQKNLSCRNLHEAQKNMYCYGFAFIPLNLLFLALGILLTLFAAKNGVKLPAVNDNILPMLATQGYLGEGVLILFTIGIIAAAFSNTDSALTAMTTSVCVDLLQTEKKDKEQALRIRHRVHILLSVLLVLSICLVRAMNDKSVIDAIYIIASYTYGPLLGMFAYGLFTKRATDDTYVPYVAVASPIVCYILNLICMQWWGYHFGYELLIVNGGITFMGLWLLSITMPKVDKQKIQ